MASTQAIGPLGRWQSGRGNRAVGPLDRDLFPAGLKEKGREREHFLIENTFYREHRIEGGGA